MLMYYEQKFNIISTFRICKVIDVRDFCPGCHIEDILTLILKDLNLVQFFSLTIVSEGMFLTTQRESLYVIL